MQDPVADELGRIDEVGVDVEDAEAENRLVAEAEGDATGVGIGHVHLKVADVEAATAFWTQQVGLELMTGWAGQAAFLAADGYHHHIGVNAWYSRGADLEPPEGPGLDAVVLGGTGRSEELRTPDGVRVVLEP